MLMGLMLFASVSWAQWNNTYGNEWIDYAKSYVRIGVVKNGIYKIPVSSLPSDFPKDDPSKFQMWHRGKEVPLLKVSSTEILFYGEMNNGASDSLVFRPASARLNPYVSMFSNEGSYFLTTSNSVKKVVQTDGSVISGQAQQYHLQKDVVTFADQFASATYGFDNVLNNSYYESSNSWTSQTIVGPKDFAAKSGLALLDKTIQVKNLVTGTSQKTVLELLVNGLNSGSHDVRVSFGKSNGDADLKEIAAIPFSGLVGKKISVELTNLEGQLSAAGAGVLRVKSIADNTLDWFGLSYYVLNYPQVTDMSGSTSMIFNFPATQDKTSRISILNAPANADIYNVSDSETPEILTGKRTGTALDVMVARKSGKELKLLVIATDQATSVAVADIHKVNLNPVYAYPTGVTGATNKASLYDYLVVTNDNLKDASTKYAQYRSSARGGAHKTLVVNIRSIYDEFNFGEPSQIAIRRFVNYMLKDGIRADKHNLLLIGHSVSWPTRVVKEMPDEVPTFGDPGSDVLLVEGLKGTPKDVAAIPVGRINAFTPGEVLDYLAKVDEYEHDEDTGWRKNVLHLSGGHSSSEVVQLKNLLSPLVPVVENGLVGGEVRAFVRQNGSPDVETVNIAPEVNNGVGMITYFGHGSQTVTDLDMGYATDVKRDYRNAGKYPLMYFNGCGVGNIFVSRLTHTLSSDWLLGPNKGAIAIVANSYKSYISPSKRHLDVLYDLIFSDTENRSIGQIVNKVGEKIISSNPDIYDITNVHQSLLQGDPALVLVRVANPDYAIDPNEGIYLYSELPDKDIGSAAQVKVGIIVSNRGRYIKDQKVTVSVKLVYADGSNESKRETVASMSSSDTLFFSYLRKKEINRIEVVLDPDKSVTELSETNNQAELEVDWSVAKAQSLYPTERIKDIIPPIVGVTFDSRIITNNETIAPNPCIKIVLEDDRALTADTALVELYIKPCLDESCSFKKISYSDKVNVTALSAKAVELSFLSTDIGPGAYEFLVTVKDNSGNTPAQPYRIQFIVANADANKLEVVNSPNPASSFVRFRSSLQNVDGLASLKCIVYDLKGSVVHESTIVPQSVNEWYWIPDSAPSGLYLYKVVFEKKDGSHTDIPGKILLVK